MAEGQVRCKLIASKRMAHVIVLTEIPYLPFEPCACTPMHEASAAG